MQSSEQGTPTWPPSLRFLRCRNSATLQLRWAFRRSTPLHTVKARSSAHTCQIRKSHLARLVPSNGMPIAAGLLGTTFFDAPHNLRRAAVAEAERPARTSPGNWRPAAGWPSPTKASIRRRRLAARSGAPRSSQRETSTGATSCRTTQERRRKCCREVSSGLRKSMGV